MHKSDNVCLSETYLNSGFPLDDYNLEIPGYIMIRIDHPANSKRGGVCMYYKNCLPLKVLEVLSSYESVTNYVASFPFTDHLTDHMMILYNF